MQVTIADAMSVVTAICAVVTLWKILHVEKSVNGMLAVAKHDAYDKGKHDEQDAERKDKSAPRRNTDYEQH